MHLNIIVSVDNNNCIGNNNDLLYDIKEDKQYFRDITMGEKKTNDSSFHNVVVMGKNTWNSIPKKFKPLDKRINIILSKSLDKEENKYPYTFIFPDLKTFMENIYKNENICQFQNPKTSSTYCINEIFIIGGSSLYKEVLSNNYLINKLYITEIEDKVKGRNKSINENNVCYFPSIDSDNFKLINESKVVTSNYSCQYDDNSSNITCNFKLYQNRNIVKQHNEKKISCEVSSYFKKHIMNDEEYQYLDIMEDLITNGDRRETRNAITYSKFGVRMEFDLCDNKIPILTTKRVACKTVIKELLWFIKGSTNNKELQDKGVHIWDGNSSREYLDNNGFPNREVNELGPIYGFQWRHSGAEYEDCHTDYQGKGVDQLKECIELLKKDPTSRRMIVCAWNPKDLKQMALPPCHILFQWYVSSDNRLSLQLYQRSGDFFLGVPFNIMSYSVLIYMVAHITGLKPGKFIHIIGDAHAYDCHLEAIREQIKRVPSQFPKFNIKRKVNSIDDFLLEDFEIENYKCHSTIKAEMIA